MVHGDLVSGHFSYSDIGGFIERNAKQSQSDNKWDQSQVLDKCLFESPPHALVPVTANTRVAVVEQGCIAFHQGY